MVVLQEYARAATGEEEHVSGAHEGRELLGAAGEGGSVFSQEEGGFPKKGDPVQRGGRGGGRRGGGGRKGCSEAAFKGGEALEDRFKVGEEEDRVFAE